MVTDWDDHRLFGLRDAVYLVHAHEGIPAGSVGRVMGWLVHDRTYLVSFRDADFPDDAFRLVEVRPDEIAGGDAG